jgi:hypothetical protein
MEQLVQIGLRRAARISNPGRLPSGVTARGGGSMSKEKIMEALRNDELKKRLLEELEVEELEERVATRPWLCYMPVP